MIYNQTKKTSNERVKDKPKNNMTAGEEKLRWMNDEIPFSLSPTGSCYTKPAKNATLSNGAVSTLSVP